MFSAKLHFWTLWPFQALCLSLDRLIGPTLVHGSSHGKGRPKLSRAGFQHGAGELTAESAQARTKSARVRTKSSMGGSTSHPARFLEASARQH